MKHTVRRGAGRRRKKVRRSFRKRGSVRGSVPTGHARHHERANRVFLEKLHGKMAKCRVAYQSFEESFAKELKSNEKTKKIENKLIGLFRKRSSMHQAIRPQDDFYNFINKEWIKKEGMLTEEQKYIVQIDTFRLTQYKVYQELKEIIERHIKDYAGTNFQAKQLKHYYYAIQRGFKQQYFEKHLQNYIALLDNLRSNPDNLWKWIAVLNQNEMISVGSPFVLSLQPDEKDSKVFRYYINLPQLSLIDLEVYEEDKVKRNRVKARVKNKYLQFLHQLASIPMSSVSLTSMVRLNPHDIYEVEQILNEATLFDDPSIHETLDGYNKISADYAFKHLNGFDWNELATHYGFSHPPEHFHSFSLTYLKHMTEILKDSWASEKWRSYWIYLLLKYLCRAYEKTQMIYFNFFGKYLYGMEKPSGDVIASVVWTSLAFNKFLTQEYVSKFAVPEHLQYTRNFCQDLVHVYKRIIERNQWMRPQTKAHALEKLDKMTLVIGSADEILEDPNIEYHPEDMWENVIRVMRWRVQKKIFLEGKKVIDIPEIDFTQLPAKFVGKQAYIVNAMYTPNENSIYIPLAYLQKPFIDLDERGIEYNLAHLGFTLGHEMSHALDDFGSLYNSDGNLDDWWTEHDKKIFKRKQDAIIKQYEAFAKRDGITFNAAPSVGEDLADISGLAICQEYLFDFQRKNKDIAPIQKLSFLGFFVYFAYQQRQKISQRAIKAQLYTNPHPLDKYRTNVPLSRLKLFRAIYDIQSKDEMYWPSTDTIW